MTALLAGYRMELGLAFRTPNYWMVQLSSPPQVVLFLSVVDAFDRPDLVTHALLAPTLIAMWYTALWTGGSVVRNDRWNGRIELHAAAPARYGLVVAARVAAVVTLSLLVVPITLLTAWLTYRVEIDVRHPVLLIAVLALTASAIVGTGIIFTSMTILSRAAITFQNSASYPLLLLGGVFVPLELLPDWVHPIGRLVFLSWSSDLIRDAVTQDAVSGVPLRLAVIAVLGGLSFAAGQRLMAIVMHRVQVTGEVASL